LPVVALEVKIPLFTVTVGIAGAGVTVIVTGAEILDAEVTQAPLEVNVHVTRSPLVGV
jgi:hypothetical protein